MARGRFESALVLFATLAVTACSSRSCSGIAFTKEQEVSNLAKQRGIELSVRKCTDASRGGWTMEGVFSCLLTADAAKKKQIIDAFGLNQEPRKWPGKYYTPTDTFTCGTRLDLSTTEREQMGKAEIWTVDGHPATTPGMESVELYFYANGQACIELERKR